MRWCYTSALQFFLASATQNKRGQKLLSPLQVPYNFWLRGFLTVAGEDQLKYHNQIVREVLPEE